MPASVLCCRGSRLVANGCSRRSCSETPPRPHGNPRGAGWGRHSGHRHRWAAPRPDSAACVGEAALASPVRVSVCVHACACTLLALPRRELHARSPVQDTTSYGCSPETSSAPLAADPTGTEFRPRVRKPGPLPRLTQVNCREIRTWPATPGCSLAPTSDRPPASSRACRLQDPRPVWAPALEKRGTTSSRARPSPSRAGQWPPPVPGPKGMDLPTPQWATSGLSPPVLGAADEGPAT